MPPRTRSGGAKKKNYNESSSNSKHTVADCLQDLGITSNEVFDGCENLEDEFRAIKKIYFAAILEHHPDKGGDAAIFRKIRTAFEVLRDLKTNGTNNIGSFTTHLQQSTDTYYESVYHDFSDAQQATPSYEHYYHAAQEEVPGYKVELARSARSQCAACKNHAGYARNNTKAPATKKKTTTQHNDAEMTTLAVATSAVGSSNFIAKDTIRIGSLDKASGTYGRWHHLECWRVPYRIWAGLTDPKNPKQVLQDLLYMDEVLLTNLVSLSPADQNIFVAHVMESSHWARQTAASKPPLNVKAVAAKRAAAMDEEAGVKGKATGNAATAAATTVTTTKKTVARATKKSKTATSTKIVANSVTSTTETCLVVADEVQSSAIIKKGAAKEHFVIPRPGVNGAIANVFEQKKFVLTGLFPEVGGGTGLSLGKERVRAMIESFGGSVTSGISGKTHYLVVGKEPGRSKVSNARTRGLPMVDLKTLQTRILGQAESLETAGPPPRIESFSAGYRAGYLMN